ncbi:helix-turn-helix transcriptional regulator [Streptomyces griseosporeus]|uniref:helix-turn-helix transcriptional regulator n=1 Tax=Streptomyces griseosporeus TaxID=1910 RepID=UPI00198FF2A5|nr:LuxR family transcriptional regulator [Streptomyces griseosporeus]GHF37203.1 helix-turn-helix transcriptional regulator [Streptomyces griseosporeus]
MLRVFDRARTIIAFLDVEDYVDRVQQPLVSNRIGGGAPPLRGRDEEVTLLEARLAALTRGEGGLVCIEGAPGSGKSRLLAEARTVAMRHKLRVFQGGADPDGQFIPLGPLLDGLLTGAGTLFDVERLRDLATAPEQRFWLLQELQDRLERAALDTPLVIALDDVQWLDDVTLLALRTLTARLSSHAILWLLAVRSNAGTPGVRSTLNQLDQAGARRIALGPLPDSAVAEITQDVLGAVPDRTTLQAARRAEGVPLLLVELLRSMRDEHSVIIEGNVARLAGADLPARFQASVRLTLDRLAPSTREVVQTASAVGRTVTIGLLAELLGKPAAALITPVQEALDAHLFVERNERLLFRHDLFREAVESSLPVSVRRALRRHAAEVLLERGAPVTEAAALLVDTAEAGDRRAVELLRTAAAELSASAPSSAQQLSRRALELTAPSASEHPAIVAETMLLLWQTGQASQARSLAASVLPGSLLPEAEAQLWLGLARVSSQYDFTEAAAQARAGSELPGISPAVRAQLLALRCLNLSMIGDLDATAAAVADALEAAAQARDKAAQSTAIAVDSVVQFYRLDWKLAFELADRAAALAAEVGFAHSLWVPEALWKAFLFNAAGMANEALAESEAGIRETQKKGQAAAMGLWMSNRSRALFDAGLLEDARAEAEATAAMADDLGMGNFADATALYTLMRVALHTNDREAVRAYAAQVHRMVDDPAILVRNVGSWLLALVADDEGRPDRAMELLDESFSTFELAGPSLASPEDPADAPVFVRMALRAGAGDRAAAAVAVAERRAAGNPGFPVLEAVAAHARGLLDNDLSLLLRAVDLYEGIPRLLPRASALEDAGRKLATRGAAEAVPHLDAALNLYTAAGAERDAARVRRELRAVGAPRRRTSAKRSPTAWPELTASEVAVIRLVAQGLTNREAAERLGLSPHTISSHLRHAFAKLDIGSRAELTRLAETREHAQ